MSDEELLPQCIRHVKMAEKRTRFRVTRDVDQLKIKKGDRVAHWAYEDNPEERLIIIREMADHHLQALLDFLQSDLVELASLLGVVDKHWFVSMVEELFDTALQFDES